MNDCWKKARKCLKCGSTQHQIKNCPSVNWESLKPLVTVPTQSEKSGTAGKPKVPAWVYAVSKEDVDNDADMVEGKLLISGKLAKVLLDPGSTHSFVRPKFIQELGLNMEELPHWIEVSIPTGETKHMTDKIWKGCEVMISDRKCPADLISLSINGYDVILGMDWLSKYYVLIDCKTKNIKLCVPGEPVLEYNFREFKESFGIVSGEKVGKFLRKRAVGFLAYIVNQPKDKTEME